METALKNPSDSYFSWEVFFLGGCSIGVCALLWAFVNKSANLYLTSQIAFGLAFAFNHPHFLSSYTLLYGDFKKNIFKRPRYFWAAVVVPVLLGALLAYAFIAGRGDLLGYTLNAMFFLVGWHYVKQIFGCVIVSSVRRKIFYSKLERRLILTNLFSLWALSFFQGQRGGPSFIFYGITYPGLGIPSQFLPLSYAAVAISLVAVIGLHVQKYRKNGIKPSPPAVAALATLYVWYLPAFAHPFFAYFIPMFHSMQYLVFVWSFKKNQVADQIQNLEGQEKSRAWFREFVGYGITAVLLGALAFEFVPKFLDSQNFLHNPVLGTSPFIAAFLIFINIHHYFIDNVIWRSDNEQVKKYLFAPADANAILRTKGENCGLIR